ncbi:hypothetical protein GCM10009733_020680 [Nonomuraea maheshkhaliensis]|uniref:Uncharacterized protein n=1 Tax=Nonomuraea maheshkhaliensis TaxID=419590 RepID=A0ABN2F2C6_9ACTN
MCFLRRPRITEADATQKYGSDTLNTLATTREVIPAWEANGRIYDAQKLEKAAKKLDRAARRRAK